MTNSNHVIILIMEGWLRLNRVLSYEAVILSKKYKFYSSAFNVKVSL